eukprot:4635651-Amphidinium_carterae.1
MKSSCRRLLFSRVWPIASGPMLFNSQHNNNNKLMCWDMNEIYPFSVNSWQFGRCAPRTTTVWITEEP